MATKSESSPPLPDDNLTVLAEGNKQEVKPEAATDNSGRPPFAIPQPMREEQVQNAVKFLSHPKVRGSPVVYRRSFLEKKGLTREEIDEAFRRVPDPISSATNAETSATTQAGQPNSSTALQSQPAIQPPQPAAAPVSSGPIVASSPMPRFQLSHVALVVGVLAASGAGTALLVKRVLVPRFKAWIQKVVKEENESEIEQKPSPSLMESAAEAAKAAASAAALVAQSNQILLNARTEEKRFFEALMEKMDAQVKEMKSMGDAIYTMKSRENTYSQDRLIEGPPTTANGMAYNRRRDSEVDQLNSSLPSLASKQIKANGTSNGDHGTGRPSSAPSSTDSLIASHPKSYMEIMAMVQRGERPPNIKEVNDMPPNPNQLPSKPLLPPRAKPWEINQQARQSSNFGLQSQTSSEGSIQPWEVNQQTQQRFIFGQQSQTSDGELIPEAQESAYFSYSNSTPDAPNSLKRQAVKITEIDPEIEEQRQLSYGTVPTERPVQLGWVPPQPPPVVMPGAADAIRRPKQLPQKQQSDDGEFSSSSKVSEPGGDAETPFAVSNGNEIQEERADGVEMM